MINNEEFILFNMSDWAEKMNFLFRFKQVYFFIALVELHIMKNVPYCRVCGVMGLNNSYCSKIIRFWEKKGQVTVVDSSKDCRTIQVALTDSGLELYKLVKKTVESFNNEAERI